MKSIKSATVGELIVELCRLTVQSVKEVNSTRGLTKKTAESEDKVLKELCDRGILTEEQIEQISK